MSKRIVKIATWNINSVRLRIELAKQLLADEAPDVLCLQEIKCVNDAFPLKDFQKAGYEHIAVNGQKGYHGVAIVSRIPFLKTHKKEFCEKGDARHVLQWIWISRGAHRAYFYVPAVATRQIRHP